MIGFDTAGGHHEVTNNSPCAYHKTTKLCWKHSTVKVTYSSHTCVVTKFISERPQKHTQPSKFELLCFVLNTTDAFLGFGELPTGCQNY